MMGFMSGLMISFPSSCRSEALWDRLAAKRHGGLSALLLGGLLFSAGAVTGSAQATPPQNPQPASAPAQVPAPPRGTVIFERKLPPEESAPAANSSPGDAGHKAATDVQPPAGPSATDATESVAVPPAEPKDASVVVSDAERDAILFTAYDLDLHLSPARAGFSARAGLGIRNTGKVPLSRLAIQISSTLVWTSFALESSSAVVPLAFVQHRINTDSDHTGVAREAVVTLPQPLAPGAAIKVVALYSGTIPLSGERLERIGAPAEQAIAADWDVISERGTWLRGYGDVLWYPTASPPTFLGEGARLFNSVGMARLREQTAAIRLRLTVEYKGDAPDAAYFCGHRELFSVVNDGKDLPVSESPGVATAEFATRALGFRTPSLFVTDRPATPTDGGLLSAVTDQFGVLNQYAAGAAKVQPLLVDWLGNSPLEPLSILDHEGQPFEESALLVTPLHAGEPLALAPVLVHTLAHAWFRSSHVWLDEGVAQFMSLLWIEQTSGLDATTAQLQADAATLALAEPELNGLGTPQAAEGATAQPVAQPVTSSSSAPAAAPADQGQSLIDAHSEVYYRSKAAAVLWMLRSIVGDDALRQTLVLYRRNLDHDSDPEYFERLLEQAAHTDLRWFFEDWVYHDRSLPDLSIVNVSSRQIADSGKTEGGWMIAVDVRNDGDAVAEVPVTVRSGTLTATERLRVPAHSNAATRILFQGTPEEVFVNDGTVPELRTSLHSRKIVLKNE